jgi:hypothetical protein
VPTADVSWSNTVEEESRSAGERWVDALSANLSLPSMSPSLSSNTMDISSEPVRDVCCVYVCMYVCVCMRIMFWQRLCPRRCRQTRWISRLSLCVTAVVCIRMCVNTCMFMYTLRDYLLHTRARVCVCVRARLAYVSAYCVCVCVRARAHVCVR